MNRTVSGCAIILLVDQVTGIATQSYASDAALLDELRGQWPPAEGTDAPAGEDRGYVRVELVEMTPVAAVRLTDRLAVALVSARGAPRGAYGVVPLVRHGGWRVARPGDGLSAFVAGVPFASERAVGVDQTHASVVVGERAIVKWFREVGPEPSRAAQLVAHLAAVLGEAAVSASAVRDSSRPRSPTRRAPSSRLRSGAEGAKLPRHLIPRPLGFVTWRAPTGVELTLAQGDEYLPGARDGWEWCVERAPDDPSLGRELGALILGLHVALATPSGVIPDPVATATPSELATWRDRALTTCDAAFVDTADSVLAGLAPGVRADIEGMPIDRPIPIQPVHGDLHVGQVLQWSGGLSVIDFDGNPTLDPESNALRQPRERDIAQMLSSIDHVGRVVDQQAGRSSTAAVEAWIAATRAEFLATVGPVDRTLLTAFEAEQECRELLYASTFLPRWLYAPTATLAARYGA